MLIPSMLDTLTKPFLVLAPMDDVTDTVFRQIVAGLAPPDLFVTEFVNVDGLQSPGRAKLLPKLQFSKKEQPIVAQIWGKVPENFYKTAKQLKGQGFVGIDINMGCPDRAVIKNGCCIALINNRELAGEIIQAVREAVGEDFPVSVKTRLGLNEIDYSWHEFLLAQKLNMLTIHGRTAKQMSKVPADWTAIEYVRTLRDTLSPTTLIVGNGDVMDRAQAEDLAKQHGLDGIMIGRGIFSDPLAFAEHSPWGTYSKRQKLELYKKHVELFKKTWTNNERRVYTLNKFCKIYVNGFDGAKELRDQLMKADSTEQLLEILTSQLKTSQLELSPQ
jgi:tRNA-dihydrouridine synthase